MSHIFSRAQGPEGYFSLIVELRKQKMRFYLHLKALDSVLDRLLFGHTETLHQLPDLLVVSFLGNPAHDNEISLRRCSNFLYKEMNDRASEASVHWSVFVHVVTKRVDLSTARPALSNSSQPYLFGNANCCRQMGRYSLEMTVSIARSIYALRV